MLHLHVWHHLKLYKLQANAQIEMIESTTIYNLRWRRNDDIRSLQREIYNKSRK